MGVIVVVAVGCDEAAGVAVVVEDLTDEGEDVGEGPVVCVHVFFCGGEAGA